VVVSQHVAANHPYRRSRVTDAVPPRPSRNRVTVDPHPAATAGAPMIVASPAKS
jgi:hypothetical protein